MSSAALSMASSTAAVEKLVLLAGSFQSAGASYVSGIAAGVMAESVMAALLFMEAALQPVAVVSSSKASRPAR